MAHNDGVAGESFTLYPGQEIEIPANIEGESNSVGTVKETAAASEVAELQPLSREELQPRWEAATDSWNKLEKAMGWLSPADQQALNTHVGEHVREVQSIPPLRQSLRGPSKRASLDGPSRRRVELGR